MNERKIFGRGVSRNALLIHIKPAGQCPAGLPSHAQEIYKEAFNSAWDQYDRPGERRGDSSREETAHRVAWAAVKNKYEKDEEIGRWKEK